MKLGEHPGAAQSGRSRDFRDNRVKRKSPTLIVELEVNCSLICNVFVRRLAGKISEVCFASVAFAARGDISLS